MKRVWLIILILLVFLASLVFYVYGSPVSIPGRLPKGKISAYVWVRQWNPSVKAVVTGPRNGLGVMKAALMAEGASLRMLKNIRCIVFLSFEEARPEQQERIYKQLEDILIDCEPILYYPGSQGKTLLRVYGSFDEKDEIIHDVLFLSSFNYSLLALYGSIPIDELNEWLDNIWGCLVLI